LVSDIREEHRLGVFENRILRRIFGPKRDEVTGEWKKLHIEELHDLYYSPSIIRILKSRRMRLLVFRHMQQLTVFCLHSSEVRTTVKKSPHTVFVFHS
jgi:hypothetical protein